MELYKNKEWLEKKYLKEKLSMRQISKLCKVTYYPIWNWLKKFGIPHRSTGEGHHLIKTNHCNLSQEAIKWLNGELLGDGNLSSYSLYSAQFRYTSKCKEYISYISNTLNSFGIKQTGEIIKRYNKEWNCYSYRYASLFYAELLPIYKKWYLNGKRIIPKDLELTSLTMRQHYIGDGHLEHSKKCRPRIILSTNRFSISDVEWLVKELIKLGFKAIRNPALNRIRISTYSTKEFLDYIGNPPVKCYEYKFAY